MDMHIEQSEHIQMEISIDNTDYLIGLDCYIEVIDDGYGEGEVHGYKYNHKHYVIRLNSYDIDYETLNSKEYKSIQPYIANNPSFHTMVENELNRQLDPMDYLN